MATFLLDNRASPLRASYRRSLAAYVSAATQEAAAAGLAAAAASPGAPSSGGGNAAGASAAGGNAGASESAAGSSGASSLASGGASDSPLYMLVLSLLLHSPSEWHAARLPMLRRAAMYWRAGGVSRERVSLLGPSSPSSSPAIRPSRSPMIAPSRSPLEASLVLSVPGTAAAEDPRSPGRDATSGGAAGASGGGATSASGGGASGGGGGAAGSSSTPLSGGGAAGAASEGGGGGGEGFGDVRPVLLFFGMVERLQAILKATGGGGGGGGGAAEEADKESGWVAAMRTRLRTNDQAVLKELVALLREYEEEMLPAGDAMEMFDALGLLVPVLAENGSVEKWLGTR